MNDHQHIEAGDSMKAVRDKGGYEGLDGYLRNHLGHIAESSAGPLVNNGGKAEPKPDDSTRR